MGILDKLGRVRLIADGGMGTMLQGRGLLPGEPTEVMNLRHPEIVEDIHRQYISMGADIINTNTFAVTPLKYDNFEELLKVGVDIALRARGNSDAYVALDIGPLGRMLKPLGDLEFEDAVDAFSRVMRLGESYGCDLIFIETMTDMYETKAALLAAKESTNLPVFVTCAYDKEGKLLTGASPEAMVAMLEGMGADAIGLNCSMGPKDALPVLKRLLDVASVPVIISPNAGIPEVRDGRTEYDLSPVEFAEYMATAAEMGASVIGGCCGTTPEFIGMMKARCAEISYTPPTHKDITMVSSYTHAMMIGDRPRIVGERLNPTGKPKLKAAIRDGDSSYIINEALRQVDEGADAIDVNFGLPGIDEPALMREYVAAIQAVTDVPLQIDSGDPEVLEAALRVYSGKALVNSVSGKLESIRGVMPLVKKYGGVLIALLMDDDGIPESPDERLKIADKILRYAEDYGIDRRDVVFDPLCLSVASGDDNARVTLECVRELHRRGLKTSLGVSNVSFGLPMRDAINSSFYTLALREGLDLAILNPHSALMMNAHAAYLALGGMDRGCADYCNKVISLTPDTSGSKGASAGGTVKTLGDAVRRGLTTDAERMAELSLSENAPTDIINREIIPALDEIGRDFESGRAYLPQLMMAAEAASAAFRKIKDSVGRAESNGRRIVLATVKGDIHDIGKNIVKLLFESYGYEVIDLGRDVDERKIVDAARSSGATLVGLSALMTTTVPAMQSAIALLRREVPGVKIIVGGAVLTEDYALSIGADYYAPDAMSGVRIANSIEI